MGEHGGDEVSRLKASNQFRRRQRQRLVNLGEDWYEPSRAYRAERTFTKKCGKQHTITSAQAVLPKALKECVPPKFKIDSASLIRFP